jgi:hypothetical protein
MTKKNSTDICQLCGHPRSCHRYSCKNSSYRNTECSCPGFVSKPYKCECGNDLKPGDKRLSNLCSECLAYQYAQEDIDNI